MEKKTHVFLYLFASGCLLVIVMLFAGGLAYYQPEGIVSALQHTVDDLVYLKFHYGDSMRYRSYYFIGGVLYYAAVFVFSVCGQWYISRWNRYWYLILVVIAGIFLTLFAGGIAFYEPKGILAAVRGTVRDFVQFRFHSGWDDTYKKWYQISVFLYILIILVSSKEAVRFLYLERTRKKKLRKAAERQKEEERSVSDEKQGH